MSEQKHYPDVDPGPDFPKLEESILNFWQENQVFERSVASRPAKTENGENNEFIFYDGPPFANGLPHYGHLLTGYVKDLFARYQTMKGKRVERRFGWDCHGLPAEMESEKELNISGRAQIEQYGIGNFNEHCRSSVMKYAGEWEYYVTRQARWVDFKNDYKTMDRSYMESVMWAFKQLYDKGLVYESHRVMPYSWAAETPLSNFETRLDNSYRERVDKAVYVGFKIAEAPVSFAKALKEYGIEPKEYRLVAWTTTPWTLPSNLALAVGEDIEYSCFLIGETCYVASHAFVQNQRVAKDPISKEGKYTFGDADSGEEGEGTTISVSGRELTGAAYEPLFPYFKDTPNAFRVLPGDFIEEGEGTGIVHMAPGFGEDDQRVCEEHGIPLVVPVDDAGKFTAEVFDLTPPLDSANAESAPPPGGSVSKLALKGRLVFDANDDIIRYLKTIGVHLKTEQYRHNYPHCWRTDTPLIYKAVPSWYVSVTEFRDRMVRNNQNINWIPHHVRDGLFGKWLEGARDWSISRNRFWGAPIPVWKSDNPENDKLYVFGSIEEMEQFFGEEIKDLHRPHIDELTKADPENSEYTLRRVNDVLDCWFESGSMPYAQVHYPFENAEWFESHFPADFIVEYVAQTRGWFYTLVVLATAIFDKHPFKNCICHGVVLDDNGQKLSKRLGNYPDPIKMFDTYGADALRWFMVSSPIMRGQDLQIDKEGKFIRDVIRLAVKPVWNAYNFFCLYANADQLQAEYRLDSANLMDRYILAKAREIAESVTESLDAFDTPSACHDILQFFDVLNNWYIRRSRDRFWKSEKDQDKQEAYNTLYSVLHMMCRLMAPLLPLVTEEIYAGLTAKGHKSAENSVHLAYLPNIAELPEEKELVSAMDRVRDACNAALAIRNRLNLRVRLPLASMTVVGAQALELEQFEDILKDEINVKAVEFTTEMEEFGSFRLQANLPVLGKKLGPKMKDVVAATKKGEWQIHADGRAEVGGVTLEGEEFALLLNPKDKDAAEPLSSQDMLVVLDTEVTPELEREGLARDLIRMIQQARKDAKLDISDRIQLSLEAQDELADAIRAHKEYISEQTLAVSLEQGSVNGTQHSFENEIAGRKVNIGFSVAA